MVPQEGSEFTNKKEDSKNPDNTRLIKPEMSPELIWIGASFPGGSKNVPVNQNKVRLEKLGSSQTLATQTLSHTGLE